jgi:hypothetical protein
LSLGDGDAFAMKFILPPLTSLPVNLIFLLMPKSQVVKKLIYIIFAFSTLSLEIGGDHNILIIKQTYG